jgi:hypothetical protein
MKKILLSFFLIFNFLLFNFSESIFDSVYWKKDFVEKNISLFFQNDSENKINFYKAEIVLDCAVGEIFYKSLTDFENYSKIFPKMIKFTKFENKPDIQNAGIYYCAINFRPLRNRHYFVDLYFNSDITAEKKKYVVEWKPVDENRFYDFDDNKKYLLVRKVYGRWQIIEENGKTKISVEYYNDFGVVGPKGIVQKIEKDSTVNAVKDIVKYVMKCDI